MAATIRAVAEAAGVSITTVSFVLNSKHPHVDAIPRATRDRVRACARELGYRSTPAAPLRTRKAPCIGVTMQRLKDEADSWFRAPYELSMLSGIQKTLIDRGYLTILGTRPGREEPESIDKLINSGISGLILRGAHPALIRKAQELHDDGLPTVVIFPLNKKDLYPYSIDVDNVRAGQLAAELFLRAGRKAPMCVVNEEKGHLDIKRATGFTEVIQREFGRPPMVFELPSMDSDVARIAAMTEFMRANKPDAVMATEPGNSFLVSFAAEGLDLSVPDDLSIIGFDCYSIRSVRERKVSAVGTSWWRAGEVAAASVVDMIEDGRRWAQSKRLRPRFIPGDTTPVELAEESDLYWLL